MERGLTKIGVHFMSTELQGINLEAVNSLFNLSDTTDTKKKGDKAAKASLVQLEELLIYGLLL